MNQEENINKPLETVNIASEPTYAGFWRRFVGWLIDLLILIILSHWVLLLISKIIKTPIPDTLSFSAIFSSLLPIVLTIFIVDFIITALYYSFFESSSLQATVGKHIAGLKITTIDGSRISFGKAFLRRIYSLLSIIPIFIGYVVAGFTARKQTFHDMLAKTVVIVYKPRKVAALVGIMILTITVWILSDMFLGAGFHVSFNALGVHYDTQNDTQSGLQNFTVQKGDEVDPVLKEAIISSYLNRKILFTSGDLPRIRQYFLAANSNDKALTKQVTDMSDSDFQKMIGLLNQIQTYITEDVLRSPNTVWTFSKTMDKVKIQAKISPTENGFNNVTLDMLYTNGQWY